MSTLIEESEGALVGKGELKEEKMVNWDFCNIITKRNKMKDKKSIFGVKYCLMCGCSLSYVEN